MHKTSIYKLLCHGFAQSKIVDILHIDKAYVSRITNELLRENYVYCANSKGNPKLYKPTDKPLLLADSSVDKKRGGRNTTSYGVVRVHSISRSYLLERPPKLPVKWDKEWVNNGTTFYQLQKVEDVGLVTVRLIKYSNGGPFGKLIVWMPERYLSYEQLDNHKRILESYCQVVANWFMRNFHCQLGLPEPYQKPEFAFPEDPEFVHLAKDKNLKSEHCWVDSSEGSPEWETDDVKLAKIRLELPERVLRLETTVDRIADSVDRLLDIFDSPKRPDEWRDVA